MLVFDSAVWPDHDKTRCQRERNLVGYRRQKQGQRTHPVSGQRRQHQAGPNLSKMSSKAARHVATRGDLRKLSGEKKSFRMREGVLKGTDVDVRE